MLASLLVAMLSQVTPARAEAPPAAPDVLVGQTAPLFTLPALNRTVAEKLYGHVQVSLTDFVGLKPSVSSRVVVLGFVRRSEGDAPLRELARIHKRYHKRGVEVLAVVADNGPIADISGWVQGLDLPYAVLHDPHGAALGRYGVKSWPLTLLVDGWESPKDRKGKGADDDSGQVLAIGAGSQALSGDLGVLVEELVETP